MYEQFTDRARKIMQLANQEAARFRHEYIGTEHILLGLVKEATGVGANVLKNLGVDLRRIRMEVERLQTQGPDVASIGGRPSTPRAKAVIEYAMKEARELNHNYVGSEHILLGLLLEQEGVAAQVLMNLGLTLEVVRVAVLELLGPPSQVTKFGGSLSPENDPPRWPTSRLIFWTTILIAWIAIAVASVVWGGVEPWKALGAVALGATVWLLGLKVRERDKGTRADDASLREEIRQWRGGPDRR